jgi:hypothetical protein
LQEPISEFKTVENFRSLEGGSGFQGRGLWCGAVGNFQGLASQRKRISGRELIEEIQGGRAQPGPDRLQPVVVSQTSRFAPQHTIHISDQ